MFIVPDRLLARLHLIHERRVVIENIPRSDELSLLGYIPVISQVQ